MEFVQTIAHKVTVLHLGKILAEGSMAEIQENEKVRTSISATNRPMLQVKDLQVGYGQSEVIHEATFSVGEERDPRHHGPQRHGKDDLLKSLIGIIQPKSGSVERRRRGGRRAARRTNASHAGLGFVPQGRMIFSGLTVFENLISGARGAIAPVHLR